MHSPAESFPNIERGRMRLGRSHNTRGHLGRPRSKSGYTKSTSESNRNCLDVACFIVHGGGQRPSQCGCKLPGASRDADVAAQRFWYGPREKTTALWNRELTL